MAGVDTFNPKNSKLVVGGKLIGGFAADSYIQVTRNADMYALTMGADSRGARVKSNNYSGRITITLMETSPSNDDLNALVTADELDDSGAVPVYFQHEGYIATAVTAWVVKRPDAEFNSGSLSNRQWVLETEYLTVQNGAS